MFILAAHLAHRAVNIGAIFGLGPIFLNPEFVETVSATSGVFRNILPDCSIVTPHKGPVQVAIEKMSRCPRLDI